MSKTFVITFYYQNLYSAEMWWSSCVAHGYILPQSEPEYAYESFS